MRGSRDTTSSVFRALAIALLAVGWGLCPHARVFGQTVEQRQKDLARLFRESKEKPPPTPLLPAERSWLLTLSSPPSAAGAMDDLRVFVPLRQNLFVAIDRETGLLTWIRPLATDSPPAAGGGNVYVVSGGAIWGLEASTGTYLWSVPVNGTITAPLIWDNGWLIAVVEPGEVLAFRASDGRLMWRRAVGATTAHPPAPGGRNALYLSLADSRIAALAVETGDLLWERQLPGTLSPPTADIGRVFVGSTNNFFFALDPANGRELWKWRNGGDVIGAAIDGEVVYFASLDNILRAVNRGNGNQRWRKPTGTRPVLGPQAFHGVVVVPGLMPAVTVFIGETGAVMGTQVAGGDLVGPPLVDPDPKPFQVTMVTITREGVVEGLRPAGLMFRDIAALPVTALPGRSLNREKIE